MAAAAVVAAAVVAAAVVAAAAAAAVEDARYSGWHSTAAAGKYGDSLAIWHQATRAAVATVLGCCSSHTCCLCIK